MYVINIIILKWKLGSKILKTEYNNLKNYENYKV